MRKGESLSFEASVTVTALRNHAIKGHSAEDPSTANLTSEANLTRCLGSWEGHIDPDKEGPQGIPYRRWPPTVVRDPPPPDDPVVHSRMHAYINAQCHAHNALRTRKGNFLSPLPAVTPSRITFSTPTHDPQPAHTPPAEETMRLRSRWPKATIQVHCGWPLRQPGWGPLLIARPDGVGSRDSLLQRWVDPVFYLYTPVLA